MSTARPPARRAARQLVLPVALLFGLCGCPQGLEPCAGGPPASFPVGTVPNDVAFAECDGEPVLLVPASGDGRLDVFSLSCGALRGSVVFVPEGGVAANPWAVAVDGERAWVTLQGQGAVALVDPCGARLLDTRRVDELVTVEPPLALTRPQDVDGDGATETTVTRMLPRAPEPVVAQGGVALVAYTDLLEPGLSPASPPVLGPAVLARFERAGDVIQAAARTVTLPCANPQGLARQGGELWVSCSGPLGPTLDAAVAALGPGALVRVDPQTLEVLETVDAGRLAPGTPALLPGGLVVGSLIRPALAQVVDGALLEAPVDGADLESLFECAPYTASDVPYALCTHFSGDRLLLARAQGGGLVVDAVVPVGAGGAMARGAQAVAVAPAAARQLGVGAAVLLGLSAEVALVPTESLP